MEFIIGTVVGLVIGALGGEKITGPVKKVVKAILAKVRK